MNLLHEDLWDNRRNVYISENQQIIYEKSLAFTDFYSNICCMDWKNVVCGKCGSVNDYNETLKSNNLVCRCNVCDKFLGNKPQYTDEARAYTTKYLYNLIMPFGKHKGKKLKEVDDNYLLWMYENTTIPDIYRAAIETKLKIEENEQVYRNTV